MFDIKFSELNMRRLFSMESIFFLVSWLAILLLFRERAFFDPGSLWHIRVGEIILNDGFPWIDPFTYTHNQKTWIPQQWAGEVMMALAHRIAQFDTLLLGFATSLAVLFTWLFHRMRTAGMGWPLASAIVGLTFFVGSYHYYVRPHMISILLLAWTAARIVDFDRGRISAIRLLTLIPLFIVWTNIHAGVLAGIFTLSLATGGWILLWLGRRTGPITSAREAMILVIGVAVCALTPLINPFGMEMIHTWERLMKSKVLSKIILEHMPLDPSHSAGQVVLGFGVLYGAILTDATIRGWRNFRITWIIPVVWFGLSMKGIRHGPLFAMVSAVIIADIWPHTYLYRYLLSHGDTLAKQPDSEMRLCGQTKSVWVIPILMVCISGILQFANVSIPIIGDGWARISKYSVPIDITNTIQKSIRNLGSNQHIYNDANLGGYMTYFHPGVPIFMDDRCELYGDEWMQNYFDTTTKRPHQIETWVTQYGIKYALVQSNPDKPLVLESYLSSSPYWQIVPEGRGESAVLYQRLTAHDQPE